MTPKGTRQEALGPLYAVGQRAAHFLILDNGAAHPARAGRTVRVRCVTCGAESERLERSVRQCVARNAVHCWQCSPVARLTGGGAKKHVLAAVAGGARTRAEVLEVLWQAGSTRSANHVSALLGQLVDERKIEKADGAYTLAGTVLR